MTNPQKSAAPQSIQTAVTHHEAGRLPDAEAIYRRILRIEPERSDAMHLLGLLELQRGRPALAVDLITQSLARNPGNPYALNHLGEAHRALGQLDDAFHCYRRALDLIPSYAEAHNNLGILLQAQERLDEAAGHFRQAIVHKPDWGGAYLNLGLTLKRTGDIAGAASFFATGWVRDPSCLDLPGQCMTMIAAQAVTSNIHVPSVQAEASKHFISVIFCSIDDAKSNQTEALYRRLLAEVPHEIIAIRDARSLSEAYNRAIGMSRGDVIVLSHDDIDILAPDFSGRLQQHLQTFDILGVVGGTKAIGPMWKSCGHPHLRGWITHLANDGTGYFAGAVSAQPVGHGIAALDGVFLAAHRDVFSDVAFDETTFDGFHLYDIDWTYRASKAGFRLGVAGDLLVAHASRGQFDHEWGRYADRFCRKHQMHPSIGGSVMAFEVKFKEREQVRQFYARLALLATASN